MLSLYNDSKKLYEDILKIQIPKTVIISSRKVIKKSKTRNTTSYSTSTDTNLCNKNKPNINSIIVSLSNPALTSKIIHRKYTHRNLKSSTVFSSAHTTSEININKVYPASVYKLFIETRNAPRSVGLSKQKINNKIILIKTEQ